MFQVLSYILPEFLLAKSVQNHTLKLTKNSGACSKLQPEGFREQEGELGESPANSDIEADFKGWLENQLCPLPSVTHRDGFILLFWLRKECAENRRPAQPFSLLTASCAMTEGGGWSKREKRGEEKKNKKEKMERKKEEMEQGVERERKNRDRDKETGSLEESPNTFLPLLP